MRETDRSSSPPSASARSERPLPGWPEVVIGLAVLAALVVGLARPIAQSDLDPVTIGLIFTALSGVFAFAGFAAAALVRVRSWTAFGIRGTSARWLLISAGVGAAAFTLKSLAILVYIAITGDDANPQQIYALGASGGILSVVLATIFMSVVTPVGEEFLFRGIVTTVLLRYGAVIGVVGGALVFAIFHGINLVFPAAFVVGLAAGEVFRRSGSIWTAVVVHGVVNLPTIPIMVLAGMA